MESALMVHQQGRRIFWEVFRGQCQPVTTDVARRLALVEGFDLNTGWNFELAQHRREFLHLMDVICPGFVWFAPPCTVWPPLQQLKVDMAEKQEALQADRDYQETTYLKMAKRGYQKQQREGRHAGVEQPKNARSWTTQTFRSMDGCDTAGWAYEEQHVKKPTKLRCTDETMALDLSRTCQGGHWHLPIEGSSPGIGSRAEASRIYQAELCYSFYLAIQQIFDHKGQDAIFAADDEHKTEIKEEVQ